MPLALPTTVPEVLDAVTVIITMLSISEVEQLRRADDSFVVSVPRSTEPSDLTVEKFPARGAVRPGMPKYSVRTVSPAANPVPVIQMSGPLVVSVARTARREALRCSLAIAVVPVVRPRPR